MFLKIGCEGKWGDKKRKREFVGKGNMLSYIQANTRKHLFFEFTCSFWLVQNPGVLVFQFCSEVDTVSLSTVLLNVASVKGSATDNHATTF